MTRNFWTTARAHYRLFHRHHGPALARCGRVGIFGEIAYHGAEVAGIHGALSVAAVIVLVASVARVLAGEL